MSNLEKKNDRILKKSNYKYLRDLSVIEDKIKKEIDYYQVKKINARGGKVSKLIIKYVTKDGEIYYLKKNIDYNFKKTRSLIKLLQEEIDNIAIKQFTLEDENILLSKEIEGEDLKHIFNNKHESEKYVKKTATLVKKLHSLDSKKYIKYLNKDNQSMRGIRYLGGRDIIRRLKRFGHKAIYELEDVYNQLVEIEDIIFKKEKLILIHGDLHPGNIVVNKNTVSFIDYKNITLGVRERDVASMLEQIDAQAKQGDYKASQKEIKNWQEAFLKTYNEKLNEDYINFYKGLIAWRNAVYSLSIYFFNNKGLISSGKGFIKESKEYIEKCPRT